MMTYAIRMGDLLIGPFATIGNAEDWAKQYADSTRGEDGKDVRWSVVPIVAPGWMDREIVR